MGKQFRFIMDENDKKAFFEYVKCTATVYVTKKLEGTTEIVGLPDELWINLYLYKNEFGKLIFNEISNGRKYINTSISPVIEFGNTLVRKNVKEIQRGRLYVEMKYYDENGQLMQKDELLDNWYRELVKWIKKQLQCVEVTYNGKVIKEYASESLVNLLEEGYLLLG